MNSFPPASPARSAPPLSLVDPTGTSPGAERRPQGPPEPGPSPGWLQQLAGKVRRNLGRGPAHLAGKGLRFATSEARSRLLLRGGATVGLGVRVVGRSPSILNDGGTLVIGDAVVFAAPVVPIRLELTRGASLSIGAETYLNDGVWLGCTGAMRIGRRVLLAPGVRCLDNDYHGLYQRRVRPPPRPITIEDDVWLATGCLILPGVTVGRGSVVAAGAVVTRDVPPFSVVAGNPARVLSALDRQRFEAAVADPHHV